MNDRLATEETEIGRFSHEEAADRDRGALNPRTMSLLPSRRGSKLLVPALLGGGFVIVILGASMGGGKAPVDTLKTEKEAAETAEQAARAVVQDPLGNKPVPLLSAAGDPLSLVAPDTSAPEAPGQIVPAIEESNLGQPREEALGRRERQEQLRQQARETERARRDAMRRAPLMALVESRSASSSGNNKAAPLFENSGRSQLAALREPTPLEVRLRSTEIATARPSLLPNRNFLIAAGTLIPCVLQTAMDSTLPGLASCVVPRTVLSDNGRVVLLEKGTRILGEYQGGLQQGQNRIFVIWNRAVTPRGVAIDLGSPAADELGRAGMGGDVETFFLKRFGGALLLSIVGDLGSAASDRLSGANETSRAPSQAAGIALQNDLRIQPRLRAAQGTEMSIFVARDFDFSRVYSLKLRR